VGVPKHESVKAQTILMSAQTSSAAIPNPARVVDFLNIVEKLKVIRWTSGFALCVFHPKADNSHLTL